MECLKLRDLLSLRKGKCDIAPHSLNDEVQNVQKENRFRGSPRTPVKSELVPGGVPRRKCCTPDRIQLTPSKPLDKPSPEPWSPTANLRMLISAASPDIRDREKKKELFRQIENEKVPPAADVIQLTAAAAAAAAQEGAPDEFEHQRPSRKQKSLGLLCQKFLARYPDYPLPTEKTDISLDEVAAELGVERRRIYDIVNVLESLQLVSRVAKNQYWWHGLPGLALTLGILGRRGEQLGYAQQLAQLQRQLDGKEEEEGRDVGQVLGTGPQPASPNTRSKAVCMNSRKDKSLRIMSEKFVMLFLVAEPRTIALDAAAKILIEDGQPESADNSKFKTKIRRLYDIANVLTSLGLIKKVHVNERGRKPAFKWVGPVTPGRPDGTVDAEDPCGKMAQLAAACRLQFEEDCKDLECGREDGSVRQEVAPMVDTPAAGSRAEPVAQTDHRSTACLHGDGNDGGVPPPGTGSDEGFSGFHGSQPLVLLQGLPSAPLLLMYGKVDPNALPRPSDPGETTPLATGKRTDGDLRKRRLAERTPLPHVQEEEDRPRAKRHRALCSSECDFAHIYTSALSADKTLLSGIPTPTYITANTQMGQPHTGPCLHAASGLSDLNLLLAAAHGQERFTIPLGHLGPTSLPYQVMVPVFCQALPSTVSAGSSLHLGLLPAAQLLMGRLPSSPPASPAAGSSSPERHALSTALGSRESPPSEPDHPVLQPIAIIKLQHQPAADVVRKDVQRPYVETYFHTPVPAAQRRQLERVQIKTASPAQRKLDIETGIGK
ncbi:transcription factor E2F7 [Amblyraja radiata]|uniref:transcription factor E2F7 n=1 Tax=Amblyraja radiata TaxID=386614 RepID=UPI0014031112|nr:transcription factor E2F7 [Amblyraja radiata]